MTDIEIDEAREDADNERRYAVAAHNADSSPAMAKDGLIARWLKLYDEPDQYTCDIVYFDRVTGDEVLRYDGADPANTDPYYGARTDGDCMSAKGLDIKELIEPGRQKVSDEELRGKVSRYVSDDDYWPDDDWDDSDYWDELDEQTAAADEDERRQREIDEAWARQRGE